MNFGITPGSIFKDGSWYKMEVKFMTENKLEKISYYRRLLTHSFLKSPIFIALLFTLIGVLITISVQNFIKHREIEKYRFAYPDHHHWFYDNPPFFHHKFLEDPFFDDLAKEITEHQKKINQTFEIHNQNMMDIFKKSKTNKSNWVNISTSEDKDNYYYQIQFSGFKKDDVIIAVNGDILKIFSDPKKQNNDQKSQQELANFYYIFPVPQRDSSKEPEINKKDDQILVKIAKKFVNTKL